MKTRLLIALVIILLSVSGHAAAAGFSTGMELLNACKISERYNAGQTDLSALDWDKLNGLMHYVLGVEEGLNIASTLSGNPRVNLEGVTVGQIVLILTKYLDAHLESLHQPGVMLLTNALIQAFPNPNWKRPSP